MLGVIASATPALARDDGRYANSPLKPWFESLHSEFGQCCTNADGYIVVDADWESDRGHYRVRIEGEWVAVPEGAVLKEPNRAGRTMVWPMWGTVGAFPGTRNLAVPPHGARLVRCQ